MAVFLMCPPDYYRIEYEINPWMDRRRAVESTRARQQWQTLYERLTVRLGAKIELIQPVKGLPDLVFTANAGLVFGSVFVSSNFRHDERKGERAVFERWFERCGYSIHRLPEDACFEGEGDFLRVGPTGYAGYQIRSDIRSHQRIGELLRFEVLSLELVEPRFYHLDTCFCPLNEREVLYFPAAFDEYGRRVIEAQIPEPIPVTEEDALRLGCNAIVIGRDVVLQEGCDELNRTLMDRGFRIHPLDLSEFHKAGGSAKCLVLGLEEGGNG